MDGPWFPDKSPVRITVLKKLWHEDLVKAYTDTGTMGVCTHFEVGDEFSVPADRPWQMPEGFCGWAWADIQKIVWGMARGGPNVFVTCCTDGYRPVVFLLEKVSGDH